MSNRRCKIHYRVLERKQDQFPPNLTLAKALALAMSRKNQDGSGVVTKVSDRVAIVPNNPEYKRLINDFVEEENLFFGTICLFLPGQMQALLSVKDERHLSLEEVIKAWDIAEQAAPEGKEYLHAITYFLAIKDHFYQIQHPALQAKAVEEYFTWLLRDKTGVINSNHYVNLQSEFDRSQIGSDLGDVRSIEIGGLVPETVREDVVDTQPASGKSIEVDTRQSVGDRIAQTFNAARKILVDLLGDVEAQKIIDSTPSEAALEVKVNISYKARRRKFPKEFMSNLASGLRNIPDGEIRVRGKDGEIKGEDARLSADMTIRKYADTSSLLDINDALTQLKEVHRRFLHDGRIVP